MREMRPHVGDRREVDRGVLADRGVRAAAGLDAGDALGRERAGAHQIFGVPLGVDVVGDGGDLVASRMRLHSASISAVLPEPTGPPMPTRSGPWGSVGPWLLAPVGSAAEQPRVLRLVAHAGDVGAERRAADLVERAAHALGTCGEDRLERGEHALAVGLPERNEPHAGRHEIGRDRLQKGVSAGSSAMPWPAAATPTATG